MEAYRHTLEEIRDGSIPAGERVPVQEIEEHLDELLMEAYELNNDSRSIRPSSEERLLSAVSAAGVILLGSGASGLYASRKRRPKRKRRK